MRRRTFDLIGSTVGALLVVVLAAAGALALWGYTYTSDNVHSQLAAQQIYFPSKAEITPAQRPYLLQYAGQEVLTGAQADAYAKKIASDIYGMPYHGVYARIATASIEHPKNQTLAADKAIAFEGVTLQGLLLEAYAFSTLGTVAFWASIISFILAGVMLILSILGFVHLGRVSPAEEFPKSQSTTS
jgi:hypothetical protein